MRVNPGRTCRTTTPGLRPGITNGPYPERPPQKSGWLEETVHGVAGLCKPTTISRRRFKKILATIHSKCHRLRPLSGTELGARAGILRRRLHRYGLTQELVIESFALVRETAGRTLGMRHFDCQLMGGWIMIQGGLAEMETGEGKTLTATLAAATAALAGIPVHVITVNDYLVARDARLMEPVYRALGLSIGAVTADLDATARQSGYHRDIAYCTNKQLAFDYLRDRILLGNDHGRMRLQLERLHEEHARVDQLFLRGLCFAIVDEADSVLIDEARTPLIISRQSTGSEEKQMYAQAMGFGALLRQKVDFTIDKVERRIDLTEQGKAQLTEISESAGGIWSGRRRREELVIQALTALHLYRRDHDYLVQDKKIAIIDRNTGRVMADRSWERGLHQMLEIKEQCEVTGQREHMARLTYQRFFRRYLRLSGMTGTAREVRKELWCVYHLPVFRVPTNNPCRRKSKGTLIFPDSDTKWSAVVRHIGAVHQQERPVLVGTGSVADSELLSDLLTQKGLVHQVLNARQDVREAEIISRAGTAGSITVTTNMAGRGTDIPLGADVAEQGGLHVLSTELNPARRIDRQLYGRCARQGDPGTYASMYSLTDELPSRYMPMVCRRFFLLLLHTRLPLAQAICLFGLRRTQAAQERHSRRLRHELQQMDEQLGRLLAFSGKME